MQNQMTDNLSRSRVLFLDIARGLAVLFMFAQHCILMHEKTGGEGSNVLASIFIFLGTAPAAPVFMLIMGVFVARAKTSFRGNVLRGFKLFAAGYLLNFLRFSLPMLIAGESPLEMLFTVDILQLAGLSLIAAACIQQLLDIAVIPPVIILAVLLISPVLWQNFGDSSVFAFLWGTGEDVFFPFFPWFVYPLLGMYLSTFLLAMDTQKGHSKKLLLAGLIFLLIGIIVYPFFPVGDYHRSGAAIHVLIIGFVCIWLWVCWFVSHRVREEWPVVRLLVFWSKNVTAIYYIQWILFGWSMLFFGVNSQTVYVAAAIGLGVLVITHFLLVIYQGLWKSAG